MAANARLRALADSSGQIIAAHALEDSTRSKGDEAPAVGAFLLGAGQYEITLEVPREVLELPGLDFQRFLSHVRVRGPGDIQVPKVKVLRHSKR
jgi:hypothetical protein